MDQYAEYYHTSMYDPCIPEGLKAFDDMTNKHKRELKRAKLEWKEIERDGILIQIVPVLVLDFKFSQMY